MFDELNQLDEERFRALENIVRQKMVVANHYDQKVNSKQFVIGDLVWKTILPVETKTRGFRKWSPNWEGPFEIMKTFSNNAYLIKDLTGKSNIIDKWQVFKEICPYLLRNKTNVITQEAIDGKRENVCT